MSKFKVGDRVRVRDIAVGSNADGVTFVYRMCRLCGLEGVVREVRRSDGLVVDIDFGDEHIDGEWVFVDEWLESVTGVQPSDVNLVELLKGYEGVSLWSPVCGDCILNCIDDRDVSLYSIEVGYVTADGQSKVVTLTATGRYFINCLAAECVLWPSRDCRTWDGWVAPRWRAKKGECYYYVSSEFELSLTSDMYSDEDTKRWKVGNYFDSEAACKAAVEKVKSCLLSQEK